MNTNRGEVLKGPINPKLFWVLKEHVLFVLHRPNFPDYLFFVHRFCHNKYRMQIFLRVPNVVTNKDNALFLDFTKKGRFN